MTIVRCFLLQRKHGLTIYRRRGSTESVRKIWRLFASTVIGQSFLVDLRNGKFGSLPAARLSSYTSIDLSSPTEVPTAERYQLLHLHRRSGQTPGPRTGATNVLYGNVTVAGELIVSENGGHDERKYWQLSNRNGQRCSRAPELLRRWPSANEWMDG